MTIVIGRGLGDIPSPIVIGYIKDDLAPGCIAENHDGTDNVAASEECRADDHGLRLTLLIGPAETTVATAKDNVVMTVKEDPRDQRRHPTNQVVTAAGIDMIIETLTTKTRENTATSKYIDLTLVKEMMIYDCSVKNIDSFLKVISSCTTLLSLILILTDNITDGLFDKLGNLHQLEIIESFGKSEKVTPLTL
jgi:hypothetical protein